MDLCNLFWHIPGQYFQTSPLIISLTSYFIPNCVSKQAASHSVTMFHLTFKIDMTVFSGIPLKALTHQLFITS